MRMLLIGATTLLMACASKATTSTPSGGDAGAASPKCPRLDGLYVFDSGQTTEATCPRAPDAGATGATSINVTIDKRGNFILEGTTGGCPIDFDESECKFSVACEYRDEGGRLTGTLQGSFHLTEAGAEGFMTISYTRPEDGKLCKASAEIAGRRR